jgi:acyl-coenzyme A synthetase/AMP-(fatty) acid ligase
LRAAGEPLNPEVIKVWRDATGLTIYDGFGQTETVNLLANYRCIVAYGEVTTTACAQAGSDECRAGTMSVCTKSCPLNNSGSPVSLASA